MKISAEDLHLSSGLDYSDVEMFVVDERVDPFSPRRLENCVYDGI